MLYITATNVSVVIYINISFAKYRYSIKFLNLLLKLIENSK